MDFDWFVGIDWASLAHEVCVCDGTGKVVERRSVDHSGDGLRELADWLTQVGQGQPERVAVGIEVPHGAVVETLMERGFAVFSLNPKQLDRFRDRFSPAGAKDDRRDARVLADALRTDRHCFRRLSAEPELVVKLRELVRAEDEMQEEFRRLANRLRDLLHRYYPQLLRLSSAADEPWLWALLLKAPTPAKGRKLRQDTLDRLLLEHRIRRLSAQQLHAALHATPLTVAPGVVEAVSEHVASLLPLLQVAHGQLRQLGKRTEQILEQMAQSTADDPPDREHRDVEILLSGPGVGRVTAATMLAQASRAIADRDYHAFRCQAGLAPVTKASGKSRRVEMRRACDGRLREAMYHMARVASIIDPASREHYQESRRRGHSHGRALRGLADRLMRIHFAMLRDGTCYDPSRGLRASSVAAKAA